jgi:hypothetical protein
MGKPWAVANIPAPLIFDKPIGNSDMHATLHLKARVEPENNGS